MAGELSQLILRSIADLNVKSFSIPDSLRIVDHKTRLGSGGQTDGVFLAFIQGPNDPIGQHTYQAAVKLTRFNLRHSNLPTSPKFQAFEREVKALADWVPKHKIPAPQFFGIAFDYPGSQLNPLGGFLDAYIVMEKVDGGSLVPYMSVLTPQTKLQILNDVAVALKIMHNTIPTLLHRDIKPANILVNPNPAESKFDVKLCDFGFFRQSAAHNPEENSTMTGLRGTPFYMAPELEKNTTKYNQKVDIYSFGATFLVLILGNEPDKMQPGEVLLPLIQARHQKTIDLLRTLLHDDSAKRPSADDLIKLLSTNSQDIEREIALSDFQSLRMSKDAFFDAYNSQPLLRRSAQANRIAGFLLETLKDLGCVVGASSSTEQQPLQIFTSQLRGIIVGGMPGLGKSMMLRLVVDHLYYTTREDKKSLLAHHFPDGIVWVSMELNNDPIDSRNLIETLKQLISFFINLERKVVYGQTEVLTVEQGTRQLQQLSQHRKVLVVLDNIWKAEDLRICLSGLGSNCRILASSRNISFEDQQFSLFYYSLPLLTVDEARELLMRNAFVNFPPGYSFSLMDSGAISEIALQCGGLPLVVRLLGKAVSPTHSFEDLAEKLSNRQSLWSVEGFGGDILTKAVELSIAAIPHAIFEVNNQNPHHLLTMLFEYDSATQLLYSLIAFQSSLISLPAIAILWDCRFEEATYILSVFSHIGLINFITPNKMLIGIHDSIRGYLEQHYLKKTDTHTEHLPDEKENQKNELTKVLYLNYFEKLKQKNYIVPDGYFYSNLEKITWKISTQFQDPENFLWMDQAILTGKVEFISAEWSDRFLRNDELIVTASLKCFRNFSYIDWDGPLRDHFRFMPRNLDQELLPLFNKYLGDNRLLHLWLLFSGLFFTVDTSTVNVLDNLRSSSDRIRANALWFIVKTDYPLPAYPDVINQMRLLLHDESIIVKNEALHAIGWLSKYSNRWSVIDEDVNAIGAFLNMTTEDKIIRVQAATTLRRLPDMYSERAIAYLEASLTDITVTNSFDVLLNVAKSLLFFSKGVLSEHSLKIFLNSQFQQIRGITIQRISSEHIGMDKLVAILGPEYFAKMLADTNVFVQIFVRKHFKEDLNLEERYANISNLIHEVLPHLENNQLLVASSFLRFLSTYEFIREVDLQKLLDFAAISHPRAIRANFQYIILHCYECFHIPSSEKENDPSGIFKLIQNQILIWMANQGSKTSLIVLETIHQTFSSIVRDDSSLDIFLSLLRDPDADVRYAALKQLAELSFGRPTEIKAIANALISLLGDQACLVDPKDDLNLDSFSPPFSSLHNFSRHTLGRSTYGIRNLAISILSKYTEQISKSEFPYLTMLTKQKPDLFRILQIDWHHQDELFLAAMLNQLSEYDSYDMIFNDEHSVKAAVDFLIRFLESKHCITVRQNAVTLLLKIKLRQCHGVISFYITQILQTQFHNYVISDEPSDFVLFQQLYHLGIEDVGIAKKLSDVKFLAKLDRRKALVALSYLSYSQRKQLNHLLGPLSPADSLFLLKLTIHPTVRWYQQFNISSLSSEALLSIKLLSGEEVSQLNGIPEHLLLDLIDGYLNDFDLISISPLLKLLKRTVERYSYPSSHYSITDPIRLLIRLIYTYPFEKELCFSAMEILASLVTKEQHNGSFSTLVIEQLVELSLFMLESCFILVLKSQPGNPHTIDIHKITTSSSQYFVMPNRAAWKASKREHTIIYNCLEILEILCISTIKARQLIFDYEGYQLIDLILSCKTPFDNPSQAIETTFASAFSLRSSSSPLHEYMPRTFENLRERFGSSFDRDNFSSFWLRNQPYYGYRSRYLGSHYDQRGRSKRSIQKK